VAVDARWEPHIADTGPEVFILEPPAALIYTVQLNASDSASTPPAAAAASVAIFHLIIHVDQEECVTEGCVIVMHVRAPLLAHQSVPASHIVTSDVHILWRPEASPTAKAPSATVASSGFSTSQLDRVRLSFGQTVSPFPGLAATRALSLQVVLSPLPHLLALPLLALLLLASLLLALLLLPRCALSGLCVAQKQS
jgi:hypothetical protein